MVPRFEIILWCCHLEILIILNERPHIFFLPWTHKFCSWYCEQMHVHGRLVQCLEQDPMSSTVPYFSTNIFLHPSSVRSCSVLKTPLEYGRAETRKHTWIADFKMPEDSFPPFPSYCLGYPQMAPRNRPHYVTWDIKRRFLKDPGKHLEVL